MCGLAGIVAPGRRAEDIEAQLHAMGDSLRHRGPDDAGIHVEHDTGIGLAHRRLSIVDLSPLGHQPMVSQSSRYVIAFNGEIYNFRALRTSLAREGVAFHGHSDTEVLLALIERYALSEALQRCTGMFALALWDRETRTVQLARDRFGEKPLFLARMAHGWAFASELRALRRLPEFDSRLDREALAQYLRHGYVPGSRTVFSGTSKVAPGTIVSINAAWPEPRAEQYWSVAETVRRGAKDPLTLEDAEAVEMSDRLLRRAVGDQMLADVPLGAFLSGGVDSSLVVALMQAQSTSRIRTFTIGFEEPAYDESQHAEAVATHLGTDHTALVVTASDALSVIPRLPTIYDEPFGDASQIPTALVAALARQHVTVALSGDGGDELFAGYPRYQRAQRHWDAIQRVPLAVRTSAAATARTLGGTSWARAFDVMGYSRRGYSADRLANALALCGASSADRLYRDAVSQWRRPWELLPGTTDEAGVFAEAATPHHGGVLAALMQRDQRTYLPDDILVKVDRATMAASLESRAPLLDHHLAEFAWRLPAHQWERHGRGKWLLRTLLDRYVPRELVDRPKMGFGIPYGAWLRGPLRDWADDLLSADRLKRDGIFAPQPITRRWSEHRAGHFDWASALWIVLMFQAWHARGLDGGPRT